MCVCVCVCVCVREREREREREEGGGGSVPQQSRSTDTPAFCRDLMPPANKNILTKVTECPFKKTLTARGMQINMATVLSDIISVHGLKCPSMLTLARSTVMKKVFAK